MRALTRRQFVTTAASLVVAPSILPLPARASSIKPRSAWGSGHPPVGPLHSEDVKFLIVHHSAGRNGHTSADVPAILRSWFNFHTTDRGWNDIAYNFIIDAEGGVWEGREGSLAGPVAGDATGGNQGFTQLVCVIGDYNSAQPAQASLDSLVSVLAWLADRYGVATSPDSQVTFTSRGSNRWPAGSAVTTPAITGHRTMSETTCPGENLNSYVIGGLMGDVTAIRAGISPTTTQPPSTTVAHEMTSNTVTTTSPSTAGASTTLPTAVERAALPGTPVLLGATAIAGLATGLLLWRLRRME